jgi:serine/threonine protein kinase
MMNDMDLPPGQGGEMSEGETAAVRAPDAGTPFGRYRLLDKIASGGMADIYRGVAIGAQGFERVVAIKRIREEAAQVADIGEMFADEARVSALLEHPNIVQVYDFGAVGGNYFIAMEYLRGKNLDEVLRALRAADERMSPPLAVFIAGEVARGLAYAHAFRDKRGQRMDIIHRDISPANIMLLHAGAVKLLDFGIARVTSELRLAVTRGRGGALKGKSPYVSPEQIVGDEVDARSDIFALGAVLWETLTGQRLFSGGSDLDTMEAVMHTEILRPSELAPGIPPALDQIVLTALARDVRHRYDTAEQMAADLEAVMRSLPSRHGDLPALLNRFFGSPPSQPQVRAVSIPVPDPFDPREGNTRPLRQAYDEAAALQRSPAPVVVARSPSAFTRISGESVPPPPTRWPVGLGAAGLAAFALIAVLWRFPGAPVPAPSVPETATPALVLAAAPPSPSLPGAPPGTSSASQVPTPEPAPVDEESPPVLAQPATPPVKAAAKTTPPSRAKPRPVAPAKRVVPPAGAPRSAKMAVAPKRTRPGAVALTNPARGRKSAARPGTPRLVNSLHVNPFIE